MATALIDERLADLALRATYEAGAANELRRVLLPACRRITGQRGDRFLAAVVEAACEEVSDWAKALARPSTVPGTSRSASRHRACQEAGESAQR